MSLPYSSSRKTGRSYSSAGSSSQRSTHTYSTTATVESDAASEGRARVKGEASYSDMTGQDDDDDDDDDDGNVAPEDDPRSSVETYASTVPSERDLDDAPEYELPHERAQVYESDAIPASASNFGKLFPTTRRVLIQHDDSTSDGNMNLRLDTEAVSEDGEMLKMTLFHLRMNNLHERQFSLRRYCRHSGREICSSKKKYAKPVPPSLQRRRSSLPRPLGAALGMMGIKAPKSPRSPKPAKEPRLPRSVSHEDADSESEEDDVELELQAFTLNSEVKATIPTNVIRLEFSNYAQVEMHRLRQGGVKKYDFEYWGEPYTWRREIGHDDEGGGDDDDDNHVFYSYELINLKSGKCMAYITQDKLDGRQTWLEAAQGGWIPASSLRVRDRAVSEDLGDVIIATGLIALADDCIKRRWHSATTAKLSRSRADH